MSTGLWIRRLYNGSYVNGWQVTEMEPTPYMMEWIAMLDAAADDRGVAVLPCHEFVIAKSVYTRAARDVRGKSVYYVIPTEPERNDDGNG